MSRRLVPIVAMLLFVISGSFIAAPPALAATPSSPFAGSWSGVFTTIGLPGGGHLTMHIRDNGLITGHATHYPSGVAGPIIGHINDTGFGFFVLRDQPDYVIPYLLFAEVDDDGNLAAFAPTVGWPNFDVAFVIAPQ